jgi:hypothetical protein
MKWDVQSRSQSHLHSHKNRHKSHHKSGHRSCWPSPGLTLPMLSHEPGNVGIDLLTSFILQLSAKLDSCYNILSKLYLDNKNGM